MTTAKRTDSPAQSSAEHDATIAIQVFDKLAPVCADYMIRPIMEGFNWSDCADEIEAGEWYLVVFRSIRSEAATCSAELFERDERALEEARAASGLCRYFSGELDAERRCLSFCIWESQEKAAAASSLPLHKEAAAMARDVYDEYWLERWHLSKVPDAASFTFTRIS